jgi:multidrug transporter EmrE-like cation transporter
MILEAGMFVGYAVLNTAAMLAVKRASAAPGAAAALRTLGFSALLYAGAVALLLALLRAGNASIVFPVAVGAAIVAAQLAGMHFLGEPLTRRKLVGTALVIAGSALLLAQGQTA